MANVPTSLLCLVLTMDFLEAQVVFVQKDKEADTIKIFDENDNTVIRTQFLPTVRKQVASSTPAPIKCDEPEREIRNSTYEIKNGKMYKVTRVRKKISKYPCLTSGRTNTRAADRRHGFWDNSLDSSKTYFQKLFPNLHKDESQEDEKQVLKPIDNAIFSVLPQLSNGSYGSSDNQESTTADRTWQFWANPITSKTIGRKKEKLKKLLNLFTIVQFDNEGCFADGLKGTCYHQSECSERGGTPMGACARGFGVCCYIERTCGEVTNENCTYFVNEAFPAASTNGPSICTLSVQKAHPLVQQLRLEFETFELQGPVNGTCLMDRFLVTGQNRNSIVPDMCGVNSGQHMYVDVGAAAGPISMNVVTMGQAPGRKWRVKVTQLLPYSELLAPQNCLQYFTDLSGVIESFNYQQAIKGNAGEAAPGYFNNLNYDVCIKKGEAFCGVTYSTQSDAGTEAGFELINMNAEGESIIPRGQAGAEVFNCPDDYIVINGVRLCGDRLNDATIELDYTKSAPVTDSSAGPAHLTVRTDQEHVSHGFRLYYKQNPCMEAA